MTRTRSISFLAGATALVLAALAVAGCGSSGGSLADGSVTLPTSANGQSATVGIADENLGKILVDSQGRTLYLFQRDSGSTSTCIGACATFWPPLRVKGKPAVGSGASGSLLATSSRPDGTKQVTYNGHPLYRYSGDQKPGDSKGEGLTAFGGSWFVLTPAGAAQVAAQPSNVGGYGY
jgi:predicted lipoprotein with Yx(FWY)xxD motif